MEQHPGRSLASVKPCPVLGSALGHGSPNRKQKAKLRAGGGGGCLYHLPPSFPLPKEVEGRWQVLPECPAPMALLTTGSGREGKPSQLLICETCCPVLVFHREDASLHSGLDFILAHKESLRHPSKSQDHSRKQEPSLRLPRQISVLSAHPLLVVHGILGQRCQTWAGTPTAGWLIPPV